MIDQYSNGVTPPGLIVPVSVGSLEGQEQRPADALIDTGADISALPAALKAQLGLTRDSYAKCSGVFTEKPEAVPTYYVRMAIADVWEGQVEVILTADRYVLLGRDILNGLFLHAYGPERVFELTQSKPAPSP